MCLVSKNNCQDYKTSHFLVFAILLLYILSTFGLYYDWAYVILTFITAGESSWTEFNAIPKVSTLLTQGIVAALSTGLADATLVWDLIVGFA